MLSNVNVNVTVNGENQSLVHTHTQSLVGNLSLVILPENANRKYVLIANESDTDIYLSLNGIAEVGKGIPLHAGGNYQMPVNYITTAAISAIHAGEGEKKLLLTEGV